MILEYLLIASSGKSDRMQQYFSCIYRIRVRYRSDYDEIKRIQDKECYDSKNQIVNEIK